MIRAAGLAAVLLAMPAAAQEALYGAQPPAGSAYVRFANATSAPVDVSAAPLANRTLGTADGERVSPYAVVEKVAGRPLGVTLMGGGSKLTTSLTLPPDAFATVILRRGADGALSATVAPEGTEFNQARARLSFYNATPGCAAGNLAIVPAGTAVFPDVAAGTSKSRNVNPVTAQIRASCAGGAAPDLSLTGMEVGGSYSVWLMQPSGQPIAFITRDTTLPYKKQ